MTVSSTSRITTPFIGTGIIVPTFGFGFKVFVNTDILAVITYLGVQTTLNLTSDYSVALNADQDGSPGGTITLNVASNTPGIVGGILAVGATMVISSQVPQLQNNTLTNFGGFFPTVINAMVDRLTILVQQVALTIGRGITFPITDSSSLTTQLPAAGTRANQALIFDSVGNVGVGLIAGAPISAAMQPVVAASTLAAAMSALGINAVMQPFVGSSSLAAAMSALGITSAMQPVVGATTLPLARTAMGAAASGANADITSLTALTSVPAVIAQQQTGGFINKLHNGLMNIWQRGTGVITVGSGLLYTADRWFGIATSANLPVQRTASNPRTGAQSPYSMLITGAASNTGFTLGQRIESADAQTLAGQQVTIQAQIYNNTGASITPTLNTQIPTASDNYTGATNDLASTNLQPCLNGQWTQISYTYQVGATANLGLQVNFGFTGLTTSGKSVQVTEVQASITPGVATGLSNGAFLETRPYDVELALCRRFLPAYFCSALGSTAEYIANGDIASSSASQIIYLFDVEARVPPTGIAVSAVGNFTLNSGNQNTTLTNLTYSQSGKRSCMVMATGTGTPYTIGFAAVLICTTVGSFILFTGAEL